MSLNVAVGNSCLVKHLLPILLVISAIALPGTGWAAANPITRATISNKESAIAIEVGSQFPKVTALTRHDANIWVNHSGNNLPDHAEINGREQPLTWHFDKSASQIGSRSLALVYRSDAPRLRLVWRWRARGARGPLEHDISIQNLSSGPVRLPLIPSFSFDWRIPAQALLQRFWVEKGADTPSVDGTHDDPLIEGDAWQGTSSTYARPSSNLAREMIPYVLIYETRAEQQGWYLGIEFSGRTRITVQRNGTSVRGEAGLNPNPGPYQTRLESQQSFVTPTIFLGAASGGPDVTGNHLRRWVRQVLNNPRTLADPNYPLMVSNSWGSGTAVDESLARRMIAETRALGLEMFHLDAGWFRSVGDWRADPAKFPRGVDTVADYAHQLKLKFGLWVDWTQAGVSANAGALNVNQPATRDWLIADPPAGWKQSEPYKGITIDLGVPAAQAWAAQEIERIVSDNHVDMLEHDGYLVAQGSSRSGHPAEPPSQASLRIYEDSGYLWADGSNSTDVSYYATRAYYAIYEQLRKRHPRLLLELCNDGGRMMDFGSAAHGDYFSITDTYDPLSNRRAFYDASYVFPPAMLETYVEKWPTPRLENLRYMLRSGMLGWFSLMLDSSQWSAEQREVARAEFKLYKTALRPLIREADLYHVGKRPDGVQWDGIEYYSARLQRGVLYAFRGSARNQPAHYFRLFGLDPRRRYKLEFHDRGAIAERIVAGQVLMQEGVEITLQSPLSSELMFITLQP